MPSSWTDRVARRPMLSACAVLVVFSVGGYLISDFALYSNSVDECHKF